MKKKRIPDIMGWIRKGAGGDRREGGREREGRPERIEEGNDDGHEGILDLRVDRVRA